MLVKRYVVKEVPEALTLIRQDLGSDAMILSTKKIQTKGFLGLFSRNKIEVIAASTDTMERPASKGKETLAKRQISKNTEQPEQPLEPQTKKADPAETMLAEATKQVQTYSRETIQENRSKVVGKTPDVHVNIMTQPQIQDVMGELRALKKLFNHMAESNLQNFPKPLIAIRELLLRQEIVPERVDEIITKLLEQMDKTWDLAKFRFEAQQILFHEMSRWQADSTIDPNTRVAAFVGATGVGKTTTIAKIAAEQVIKQRKKIALITTDTYRIAAVEQLRTYANILNIPLEVVFTPEDYKKALQTFQTYDLILVDTAGRNYHDKKFIDEIQEFFVLERPQELYLVLSATSKMQDIEKMIRNFSALTIDKYLFTKLDETTSYGVIYNSLRLLQKPFTYVTDGQDVPDHLSVLTGDKLVNLLIGDSSYV